MPGRNEGRLDKIRITPLAAESLGVRSMCTQVETPDVNILLDAGVSLCPNRFGLPPHPIEFRTIIKLRKKIADAADKAQVVTISHYHFDHHTPSYEDWLVNWTEAGETARQIYQGKRILLKNPRQQINPSQRHRAWLFQKTGGKNARVLEIADGKTFTLGESTVLKFSDPVAHGSEDALLGWVIMAEIICGGERFLFAPDVQGPITIPTFELILSAKPQVVMIGGPPFYLSGFKINEQQLETSVRNLSTIAKSVPLTILDHHTLRDALWQEKTERVRVAASSMGHRVVTAAEYSGGTNLFLEAFRKQLYADYPPSKEFEKWSKTSWKERGRVKPPL